MLALSLCARGLTDDDYIVFSYHELMGGAAPVCRNFNVAGAADERQETNSL